MRHFLRIAGLVAVALGYGPIATANLVVNPGFEAGSPSLGPRPKTFGTWQGDRVGYVGSTPGITPLDGDRMLQFIDSEYIPNTTVASQYWQNIDLSGLASEIAGGHALLNASAWFNRVSGDAQTDTEFQLIVRARGGTPSAVIELGSATSQIFTDGNPATWERAVIDGFVLPVGTNHVQLEINAIENVFNDSSYPEYDGHFADSIALTITTVPEPSTYVLVITGFAAILVPRCRISFCRSSGGWHW